MRKLDPEKLKKLSTVNDDLDRRYGKQGTAEREKFDEESLAWSCGKSRCNKIKHDASR